MEEIAHNGVLFELLYFCLRRKIAGSRELETGSASHRRKDVRRSDFRRQTVTRKFDFSSQAQDSWELLAVSYEVKRWRLRRIL